MKCILFFLGVFFVRYGEVYGQSFNKNINKDSLLKTILIKLPEEKRAEIKAQYDSANDMTKEFLLFMFSMPTSSKKEMTANLDSNFENIKILKNEYSKLVPRDYVVSIEFHPADKVIVFPECIDLMIEHTVGKEKHAEQQWNLSYRSDTLAKMISGLGWTSSTLQKIKNLLEKANCIRIENGDIVTVGYARSGMGLYSFKLFSKDLSDEQIKKYNDGCRFIFFKKNIVLEYDGGAVGPQCFPN